MAITRWDPFRDVLALQNRMNSLFQDYSRNLGEDQPLAASSFVPPVDIYEDENSLSLTMEIPGVKPEDLDIQVENNTLTVRGERRLEKEEKEDNFHRVERRYGSFYRAFSLPSTVDSENVNAQIEHGVLRLKLNKKPEAKPKQIKVNVQNAGKQIDSGHAAAQASGAQAGTQGEKKTAA